MSCVSKWLFPRGPCPFIEGTLEHLDSVKNRYNNVVEQEQSWITIFTRILFSRSNGVSHCIPLVQLVQNWILYSFSKCNVPQCAHFPQQNLAWVNCLPTLNVPCRNQRSTVARRSSIKMAFGCRVTPLWALRRSLRIPSSWFSRRWVMLCLSQWLYPRKSRARSQRRVSFPSLWP